MLVHYVPTGRECLCFNQCCASPTACPPEQLKDLMTRTVLARVFVVQSLGKYVHRAHGPSGECGGYRIKGSDACGQLLETAIYIGGIFAHAMSHSHSARCQHVPCQVVCH